MAASSTMTMQDTLDSQYLTSSFSNLSRSRSTNSLIVRTYKQATQLYLTRRFKEALEVLEPIVTPQQQNGATNGEGTAGAAPVAQSTKGTRTKVWVFYLSLLHAIIELGPEDGKLVFGSTRWRQLANKAREGSVRDEITRAGYGGQEGEVDADVVVILATLLLGHMPTQKLNQQKLETWLATSEGANVPLDGFDGGIATPMSSHSAASSPRTLATRLKILELYALHVLPANEEWQYAQEFIEMNDMLDEERREAFLGALQQLREEKDGTAKKEQELAERREREMEEERRRQAEEEKRKAGEARKAEENRKAAETERQKASSGATRAPTNSGRATAANGQHKQPPSTRPSSSKASKKPPAPPATFYRRASSALNNLQQMVLQASRSMTGSNTAMFRLVMFMLAFLVLVARRDIRERVRRVAERGWDSVRRTVGMGVKVSYI